MGGVAAAQGKLERAETLYQEGLSLYQEVGDRPGIAECLRGLASVVAAQADAAKAACLFGAAEGLREAIGASLLPDERAGYDGMVAAARACLGDKAFAAAWASGRTMMLEQAVAYALGKTDA